MSPASGAYPRTLVHMAAGLLCPTLAWLPAAAAIGIAALFVGFNLWVLPRLADGRLRRPGAPWGPSDRGLVLYPASVLVLLLVLPHRPTLVACAWALLAFGDGAASLAGRLAGGPRLPWNPAKSAAGTAAFFLAGGAAVAALLAASASGALPFRDGALLDPTLPCAWWGAVGLVAAAIGAAVESLPGGLNDNLTVTWSGAAALAGLAGLTPGALAEGAARAVSLYPSALAVTLVAGITAYLLRAVSLSGLIGGVVVGTLVAVGLGWWGLGALGCFFVLGSAATRAGLARKQALGIAEDRAGSRGAVHALAKGSVPALCALLALAGADPAACGIAFAGAVAAATFDTVASEIGKWLGGPTLLLGTLRRVPPGTRGGVSLAGTLSGAAGAALVAGLAAAGGLVPGGAGGAAVWVAAAAGTFSERPLALLASEGGAHPAALNLFNTLVGAAVALLLGGALPGGKA